MEDRERPVRTIVCEDGSVYEVYRASFDGRSTRLVAVEVAR